MIRDTDLKTWLHQDLAQRDKLLLILASFEEPCQIRELQERARIVGFQIPSHWNPSNVLKRTKGMAIKLPNGWEITALGKQRLQKLGVSNINPSATHVAATLRSELSRIVDKNTRVFVEEAISCFEANLFRSAIVMSWVGAVAILRDQVCAKHLKVFNAAARKVDPKWKIAKTTDDLSLMREARFLDRLVDVSLVGKDVRKELENCLNRRNSCGHPNSLQVGENTVSHHIEILLLNVFQRSDWTV